MSTHTDYKGAGLAVPAYPPIQWQAGESDVARLNALRILVETQEPVTIRYVRMAGHTRSVAVTARLQARVIAAVARGRVTFTDFSSVAIDDITRIGGDA